MYFSLRSRTPLHSRSSGTPQASQNHLAILHRAVVAFLIGGLGPSSAWSAALNTGHFVENEGWKARITVDCLLKDKLCGSFRYETQGCEGDLIYLGETATGFEFRAELRAGRCLPGCTLQLSSDFSRYAEVCRTGRHAGTLVAADALATAAPSASGPVVIQAPAIAPAAEPVATPPVVSVSEPATAPANATERVERTADSVMKGVFSTDSKTGAITGQVRIEWTNGNLFDGTMVNGKRQGKGRFVWANGNTYDGDWRDDVATGNATIVFANGDRYEGQVKEGIPNGEGRKQFSNGDRYEGTFAQGVPDVQGTYTEKDGSRYTGQWKAGLKHGRGKFVWASGQSYEGDWVTDRAEGKGVIGFANGDRYDGDIKDGLPHGKGLRTYGTTQDRYEGDFVMGDAQGQGTYRWKNGDTYAGAWAKGKKAGTGRYTWTNGDYWEGEFADDRQTEAGRLYFTPTLAASGADVDKLAKQTSAAAAPTEASAAKPQGKSIDHAKLLAIPMVAKEVRECSRKDASNCTTRIVNDVLNDTLFQHKWQVMSSEKDAKGKTSVFEVDTNSVLEGGNVFSWLRSGDGATSARNIGVKYDCRAQSLEIQLIYTCSGNQLQNCTLDPNIDKYAGKVIPATDIKGWFKGACER